MLLQALALLATGGVAFACRIYSDGPLLEPLTRLRDDDIAPSSSSRCT